MSGSESRDQSHTFFLANVEDQAWRLTAFKSYFPHGARCNGAKCKQATADLDDRSSQQDKLPVGVFGLAVLSFPVWTAGEANTVINVIQFCLSSVGDQFRFCGGQLSRYLLSDARCNRVN